MNTAGKAVPILPMDESEILFADKELEWGFPKWQSRELFFFWKQGYHVEFIAKKLERDSNEIRLALFEFWIDGKIQDIQRAFPGSPSTLLVSGREQLRRQKL